MNFNQIHIHQDDFYNFFATFDTLSPLRKDIWKLVLWYVKRFPVAMPMQSTIATQLGCSRSAVSEAFGIFKGLGWLHLQSRGFKRSKVLGVPTHLQQMDLINRQYFRRVEATYRATHSYSRYKRTGKEEAGTLKIPIYLEKAKIPLEAKLKLSLLPEYAYQEALHICKRKAKQGFTPEHEVKYFTGTAFKVAERKGFKPNWKAFYATVGKYV